MYVIATSPSPRPSELSFVVKGNPLSQNRAWRIITFNPGGGRHPHASMKLSDEGIEYKAEVARIAALVRPPAWDRENEYVVECVYYFESLRSDVDGPGKLVLDSLSEFELQYTRKQLVVFTGLWKNDRQVWTFTQRREKDAANPRAEITVKLRRPWKPQQAALL